MATREELRPIHLTPMLKELVPGLRQALEQGMAHERFIEQALKDQRTENAQVRKALQLFDPAYVTRATPPPKRTNKSQGHVGVKRANGTATGFGISVEATKSYVDEILRVTDNGKNKKKFKQRDIYAPIGADQAQASSAFKFLRSINFLAKSGKAPDSTADLWAVDDLEAYDRLVKQLEEPEA